LCVRAGVEIVAEWGVRVFCDYLAVESLTDRTYGRVFELESTLGARPEFWAIARYIQVIARRSDTSVNKVTCP
jgi:hypothetical protein